MRKKLKGISISWKITLMYGGLFAVAIMLISTVMTVNMFFFYRNQLKNELTEAVNAVEELILYGGYKDEDSLRTLKIRKSIDIQVRYIEAAPGVRGARPSQEIDFRMITPDIVTARQEAAPLPAIWTRGLMFLSEDRIVNYDGEVYYVRAVLEDGWSRQIIQILVVVFALLQIAGIAGSFAVGRYISKRMLRPINDMIDLASEISIEDLSRRIAFDGPQDEIGKLARTFNEMIDRLEISFKKQGQFISDASHELRTPISVIRGYANLLGRWGRNDPDVLTESIESIKAETEHMSVLVKKLLFLANQEQNPLVFEDIDLNMLLKEIVKDINIIGEVRSVELDVKDDILIRGDLNLIKQAIWIFIENSIKYAKNGGPDVTITQFKEEQFGCISIADNGIGIKKEDIPYVFDRFYRGDKSRSKEIPGTGLGLSIAGRILAIHKAEVEVKSEWGEGCEMVIRFPLP